MNYSYTVRALGEKTYAFSGPNREIQEIKGGGAVVTIRDADSGRVVQQFPRAASEAAGHRLARFHIKLLKGLK